MLARASESNSTKTEIAGDTDTCPVLFESETALGGVFV